MQLFVFCVESQENWNNWEWPDLLYTVKIWSSRSLFTGRQQRKIVLKCVLVFSLHIYNVLFHLASIFNGFSFLNMQNTPAPVSSSEKLKPLAHTSDGVLSRVLYLLATSPQRCQPHESAGFDYTGLIGCCVLCHRYNRHQQLPMNLAAGATVLRLLLKSDTATGSLGPAHFEFGL